MKEINISNKTKESIKCPLCSSDTPLEYRQWMSTHLYVCHECPFIAMEYYNNDNVKDLQDYLNFN